MFGAAYISSFFKKNLIKKITNPNLFSLNPFPPPPSSIICSQLAPNQKCYSLAETFKHLFITWIPSNCLQFSSCLWINEHLLTFLTRSTTLWAGWKVRTKFNFKQPKKKKSNTTLVGNSHSFI